jgi:hypothetical protein
MLVVDRVLIVEKFAARAGAGTSNHRSFLSAFVDRAENLFAFQAEVDAFDIEGGTRRLLGADDEAFPVATLDADFARSRGLFEKFGQVSTRFGIGVDLHGADVTPERVRELRHPPLGFFSALR